MKIKTLICLLLVLTCIALCACASKETPAVQASPSADSAETDMEPVDAGNLENPTDAADPKAEEADSAETVKEETKPAYREMTMEEAKVLFSEGGPYLIVDVRRPNEFETGHIPGAINIPNETIGTEPPAELPDLDADIYLYCRSGNRSGQAAVKLSGMGYTNVVNFGGILDWTGEVVK